MEFRHTPRLFIDAELGAGLTVEAAGDQAHYLQHVLRLKVGDVVRLFNGRDGEWKASIAVISKKSLAVAIQEQTRKASVEPDLWLCSAPIKKAHFDYMIEKATELGVTVIQPILTARTQIREVNVERCRAIAIEAAEQSDRLTIPEIRKSLTLDKLVGEWPNTRQLIVCAEWGEAVPIHLALSVRNQHESGEIPLPLAGGARGGHGVCFPSQKSELSTTGFSPPLIPPASGREIDSAATAILTGPEGGLAADELKKLRGISAAVFVRLGPRILRADTAAIAALACWQAQCGDWQGQ